MGYIYGSVQGTIGWGSFIGLMNYSQTPGYNYNGTTDQYSHDVTNVIAAAIPITFTVPSGAIITSISVTTYAKVNKYVTDGSSIGIYGSGATSLLTSLASGLTTTFTTFNGSYSRSVSSGDVYIGITLRGKNASNKIMYINRASTTVTISYSIYQPDTYYVVTLSSPNVAASLSSSSVLSGSPVTITFNENSTLSLVSVTKNGVVSNSYSYTPITNGMTVTVTNITADTTLVVNTALAYTVTLVNSSGISASLSASRIASGGGGTITIYSSSYYCLESISRNGSTVVTYGQSYAGTSVTYSFSNITADTVFTVYSATRYYTITCGDNVSSSPAYECTYGQSVTFTFSPPTGYKTQSLTLSGGTSGTYALNGATSYTKAIYGSVYATVTIVETHPTTYYGLVNGVAVPVTLKTYIGGAVKNVSMKSTENT